MAKNSEDARWTPRLRAVAVSPNLIAVLCLLLALLNSLHMWLMSAGVILLFTAAGVTAKWGRVKN